MTRRRKLATMLVVGLVAAAAGTGTLAAFVATTDNSGDRIESGSVAIGDNGGGSAMLSLSGVEPGAFDSGCIKVTYSGSLASTVRLYGSTTGSGLAQYLDLTVTRGTYTPSEPSFDSCTNFQADSTDYIGEGAGVVYNGTLQGFPDDYAGGLVDPTAGSPESWATDEVHVYRFAVQLRHNLAAQGLNANQTFTWEARNQ
jgi:hypothetical protein